MKNSFSSTYGLILVGFIGWFVCYLTSAYSQTKVDYEEIKDILQSHIWRVSRICEDDSCYDVNDSSYYYLRKSFSYEKGDTALFYFWIGEVMYVEGIFDTMEVKVNVCNPEIAVYPKTKQNQNFYKIFQTGESGQYNMKMFIRNRRMKFVGPFLHYKKYKRIFVPVKNPPNVVVEYVKRF